MDRLFVVVNVSEAVYSEFSLPIDLHFSLSCTGYLSYWFVAPVIVGIAFEVAALVSNDYNRPELPAFAFFISIWATTMLQYWQRIQQISAMKWNMTGVSGKHTQQEQEQVRYGYHGVSVKSPIDGKDTIHFNSSKRSGLYIVSAMFMLVCIVACFVSIAALFYLRSFVRSSGTAVSGADQWITPAMLSLQMTIANRILYTVCALLTQWENHRLDEDYDFAITGKE